MLTRSIVQIVGFCTRHAWAVIVLAIVLATGSGVYTARYFGINANIDDLMSSRLDWRKREIAYHTEFPQSTQLILVVVDGPTPEAASAASAALVDNLAKRKDLFRAVIDQGGGAFFRRNGLLYASTEHLEQMTGALSRANPLIGALKGDPSLRGMVQALSFALMGVQQQEIPLDAMAKTLDMAAAPIEKIAAGEPATFSWKEMLQGGRAEPSQLRHFVSAWPYLNSSELEPAAKAVAAIRDAVKDLKLDQSYQAKVRITGPAVISDEELASANEGVVFNGVLTGVIVIAILWLALRSWRLVFAACVTLGVGLAITAAIGLMIYGSLNPISIAFAVLFLGLGADFAIQFTVRYRAARFLKGEMPDALVETVDRVGAPLTLAAGAAAAGFLSFLPTPYEGLAELGTIAGVGMLIAYAVSLTLLPALLWVINPPPEPHGLRLPALAPVDAWLKRHRYWIIGFTAGVTLIGLPALAKLDFDFDPLHLRPAASESVATIRELSRDPNAAVNAAQVLAGSPQDAAAAAKRLAALPEVAQVRTLDTFVPGDQDRKLPLLQRAATALRAALERAEKPAPSDAENVAALRAGAAQLRDVAGDAKGPGADAARRLAENLAKLAEAGQAQRALVSATFTVPLKPDLAELRESLQAERVTRANLPRELVDNWVSPNGKNRVEIAPKGDSHDDATLRRFASAVLAAAPDATGQAVSTFEWADTIIWSFEVAAAVALVSIALLLWIVLGRLGDVLLTLIPLIAAALLTLEICALTGFPLNYANIIALPVLLGVGVAFKIYYILAWRRGQTDFLQSALTRAVFFSAVLTATAFGSLWLSAHPGTSSMGKLLALSLACTLASAVLFQPALMGEPRKKRGEAEPKQDQVSKVAAE